MTPDELYSFGSLWHQYRRCRANKRNSLQQLAFEVDAEAQLLALQAELREHSYRPGTSICFVTEGPKPREVFAADFRDRVVHHLLVSQQERVFEPRFIHDSYACRRPRNRFLGEQAVSAQGWLAVGSMLRDSKTDDRTRVDTTDTESTADTLGAPKHVAQTPAGSHRLRVGLIDPHTVVSNLEPQHPAGRRRSCSSR